MPSLISSAYAQDAAGGGGLASAQVLQFLPYVMIFVVFYFLMIRPQQQQQKALKAKLAAIKRGDRVLTGGGILGVVQKVRDGANEVEVEISGAFENESFSHPAFETESVTILGLPQPPSIGRSLAVKRPQNGFCILTRHQRYAGLLYSLHFLVHHALILGLRAGTGRH